MNKLKVILFVVLGLALVGGGYTYWKQHKVAADKIVAERLSQKAVLAPAVTVTRVVMADFVETANASGSLVPREEILVAPEIEGFRVLELFADQGSRVKKGDVLARLATDQLDAQVAQNKAAIARADAAISQAKSSIIEAEARAAEAKSQLARAVPLKKSGYLSGATYDQRQSAARTSAAQVETAKQGLQAAIAEKAQQEALEKEIAWRRSKTDVTAPADGIVSRRTARIGATATAAGEPMFRIIQNGDMELDAEVVETELARVVEGQKATVDVPGAGEFDGTVRLISPEIDKATRLGRVRILIGADPKLRVGAFARARIATARSHGLAAPNTAVTFDAEGAHVQRITTENKIEVRNVETGLISGELVEITKGLADGDTIVTRAGTFLRSGDSIRPVLPDAKLSEAQ